jgi:hypothetical protein
MKSILEIKLQVKENDPDITDEELRLCVESLDNIAHFYRRELIALITAIRQKETEHRLTFKAEMAWKIVKHMSEVLTKTPQEWLGPNNTPGTTKLQQRLESANAIYRKVSAQMIEQTTIRNKAKELGDE